MEHFKPFGALWRYLFNLYLRDLRRRRSPMQQVDYPLNRRLVALNMPFDTSVSGIAYPTEYAELSRLVRRPRAKEDALHLATDPDRPGDAHHQRPPFAG